MQVSAAVASRPLQGAAPPSTEFIQQNATDGFASECLPEAPSDKILPLGTATVAGSLGSVLGKPMASPAQPVTVGLPGGDIVPTHAALSLARLPPQHGEGLLMTLPQTLLSSAPCPRCWMRIAPRIQH